MTHSDRAFGVVLLVAGILAGTLVRPVPACAQTQPSDPVPSKPRPARPVNALFGGNNNPDSSQGLNLQASLSGSFDDNLYAAGAQNAASASLFDPRMRKPGVYSVAQGSLSYDKRGERGVFGVSTAHAFNYYPDLATMSAAQHSVSAAFTFAVSKRLNVQASEDVRYSPFYSLGLLPAGDPATGAIGQDPHYGVVAMQNLQTSSAGSLSARVTPRTTLTVNYAHVRMDFTRSDRSYTSQGGGATVQYRLTPNASVRLGYNRRDSDFGLLFPGASHLVVQHDIDAGIDYSRALSFSRRTKFGFSTGSSAFSVRTSTGLDRMQYRLLGNAYLTREMGRSWTLRADYARRLLVEQGLGDPIFADQYSVGVGGYAGYRTYLSLTAAYTEGEPATVRSSFGSYTGRAHLQFALTRYAAASVQYLYYHYRFGPDYPLPPGIAGQLDRQTAIVGIDLWAPLFR